MALVLADRVQETSTTSGTGTLTLAGAVSGFQSFAIVGDTNTCYYTIVDGAAWEVGIGTYSTTGPTLARTTVISNSSGTTSPLTLTSVSKQVFLTYPAEKSVNLDASGNVSPLGVVASGTWQASTIAASYGGTGLTSPGTSGYVLTSTGTGWVSSPAGGGGSSTITINNKIGAYTVVAGDLATVINCTANTFTVSLTAAATLGSGFNCTIWNTGGGVITIDPNASESIDGVLTVVLRQGEGAQIICNGTNWETGAKKTMRGYAENIAVGSTRPAATGAYSVSLGSSSSVAGTFGLAIGFSATSAGISTTALGKSANASSNYATAIGLNSAGSSSQAVTGDGAMALGGSYASGTDSFAAAIGDNTSSYGAQAGGAIAIGGLNLSNGTNAVSMGYSNTSSGSASIAIGNSCNAGGTSSIALGQQSATGGTYAFAAGYLCQASVAYSFALGYRSSVPTTVGKFVYSTLNFSGTGDNQTGMLVLQKQTTNATASRLATDSGGGAAATQLTLPNNGAMYFKGMVLAGVTAAGNTKGWTIEGVIKRGANAASTVLVGTPTVVSTFADAGAATWSIAVTADTTIGCLAITATGQAATTIRWTATLNTAEMTI